MIYCIYCGKTIYKKQGFLTCESCPCEVHFSLYSGKLRWIEYHLGDYYIDTDLVDKQSWLVTKKGGIDLVTLNYLIDVNPQNVKYWIDKLLKLQAFS
jgi:hypothetical protein